MRELGRLIPNLDPPAGGLARLQRSIASSRVHGRRRHWAWAAAAACIPIAVLGAWMPQWIDGHRQATVLTTELLQRLSPRSPAGGITVAHGAAIELPSGQPDVRLYLVQSAPPAKRKP